MQLTSNAEDTRTAQMDTLTAIMRRRSIGKMLPDVPPQSVIETLLDAATRAPNHHRTEPWFFHVITGAMRPTLGAIVADAMQARGETEAAVAKARGSFLRAPIVIVVTAAVGRDAAETLENRDAVAAAIQNMLLAGTALGLATMWRTGKMVSESSVRDTLGIAMGEEIVGFVYVGYPAIEPAVWERQPHTLRARWWSGE